MVEADSHLKLDIYKEFEHIDMLYAVHWHAVTALHSFTHPNWLLIWDSGSLVESKWCQHVVVEAEGHLKLPPTSTLHIYREFEHIDKLSIGIQ